MYRNLKITYIGTVIVRPDIKKEKETKDNQFPIIVHAEQITNLFLNIGEPHRINKTSTKAKTGGKIAQGTKGKKGKKKLSSKKRALH